MSGTLNYQARARKNASGPKALPTGVRASFGFAVVGVTLAVVSLFGLGERLVWEGGQKVYFAHFPFVAIWVLCAWGAICAIGSCLRGHARAAAVAALIVNLILAGFFVRSYARASRDTQAAANTMLR